MGGTQSVHIWIYPISWLYSTICLLSVPKFLAPSQTYPQIEAFYVFNCLLIVLACIYSRYLKFSMSKTEFPCLLPIFSLPTVFYVFVNGSSPTLFAFIKNTPIIYDSFFLSYITFNIPLFTTSSWSSWDHSASGQLLPLFRPPSSVAGFLRCLPNFSVSALAFCSPVLINTGATLIKDKSRSGHLFPKKLFSGLPSYPK